MIRIINDAELRVHEQFWKSEELEIGGKSKSNSSRSLIPIGSLQNVYW